MNHAADLRRGGRTSFMVFCRWSSSFVFVVFVHVVIILTVLYWNTASPPIVVQPMAAIMIDLAPLPAAPEVPTNALPPGFVQKEAPPESEPIPEIEPLPEIPEVVTPAAVIPPKSEIEEKPEEHIEETAQEEKAPPSIEAPPAEKVLAPMQGALSLVPSHVKASWQSMVVGHLERQKRYPRKARRKRQEATVTVRVSIKRDGYVDSYKLEHASQFEALNKEVLAMVKRAEPLPPPPKEMIGETIEFVVPVVFSLRN